MQIIGAGIQSGVLMGSIKDVLPLDVVPVSIGIETLGGRMIKLIEANTTIPTTYVGMFTADVYDFFVKIHVLQGEDLIASQNETIELISLKNKAIGELYGVPLIRLTLDIDANSVLKVSAEVTEKMTSLLSGNSSWEEEALKKRREELKKKLLGR